MELDLNNPKDLNIANVRKLLASGNPGIDLEIRVTNSGIVFLSDVTGPEEKDGICFRICGAPTDAGDKELIGLNAKAVTDDKLVDQVLRTLEKAWARKAWARYADLEP